MSKSSLMDFLETEYKMHEFTKRKVNGRNTQFYKKNM